jgi:hypothetical protein
MFGLSTTIIVFLGVSPGHHKKTAGGDLRLGLEYPGLAQPQTPVQRAKAKAPAREAVCKVISAASVHG